MSNTKTCSICCQTKPLVDFYERSGTLDGARKDCKDCCRSRSLRNHYADKDNKNKKKMERYRLKVEANPSFHAEKYAKNKEYMLSKSAEYYKRNAEGVKARVKEWATKNRGKATAIKKAYKLAKSRACPRWVYNNEGLRRQIDEVYKDAEARSRETGTVHHVDHIIPLRGKNVSGLHVPWNLQVLTGSENCSKSNKLLYTE